MKKLHIIGLILCCATYIHPQNFVHIFSQANDAFAKGQFDRAITLYQKALSIRNDAPEGHFNLGVSYTKIGSHAAAIARFKHAIALRPNYAKAHCELAKAYQAVGNHTQAEEHYSIAHTLEESSFEPLYGLATLKREREEIEQAVAYFKKAHAIRPHDLQIMLDLGNALNCINSQEAMEEALEYYFMMLKEIPHDAQTLYNVAFTLKKLNRVEEALTFYAQSLSLKPENMEGQFSYGLALLVTGYEHPERWPLGWHQYEYRWKKNGNIRLRNYVQPLWDGSSLEGKTLFIWSEQGLGDTYQFVRYASVAKQMGAAKVIVAVQKPLIDIITLCPYIDQVIWTQEQPAYFDYHIPLLSMPYLTQTTLASVPAEIPYLYAKQELVERWNTKLQNDTNFKIGICWQGNANYSTQFLRMAVAAKSLHIKHFIPLMRMEGVSVYSLQKVSGTEQLQDLPDDAPLILFDGDFDQSEGRFMDTAAVMKNLNLVITIDTSICHLAAGLGVPTWNMLPNPADWRWMLDCDSTPWYPHMRLFRQQTPGDWDSVIATVIKELQAHFEYGKPLITFSNPCKA